MSSKTYSEKLTDPRWQKKRLEILNRDNWTCTKCGEKNDTLHVHHFQYHGEPWEIDNSLLVTLCKRCHYLTEEFSELTFIKIIKLSPLTFACYTSTDILLCNL